MDEAFLRDELADRWKDVLDHLTPYPQDKTGFALSFGIKANPTRLPKPLPRDGFHALSTEYKWKAGSSSEGMNYDK